MDTWQIKEVFEKSRKIEQIFVNFESFLRDFNKQYLIMEELVTNLMSFDFDYSSCLMQTNSLGKEIVFGDMSKLFTVE